MHERVDVATRPMTTYPASEAERDVVVVEEPLEVRVEGDVLAVLMRTPGHDLELVAGWLHGEGVIEERSDLAAIASTPTGGAVDVRLAAGVAAHAAAMGRARRQIVATSACGVCGRTSIDDALRSGARPSAFRVDDHVLLGLSERLSPAQPLFAATGSAHAAALFDASGALELVREDVGRHNAVDKIVGARLLADRVPVEERGLFVTSRAGFEIVQKAVIARIGLVVAVGGASSLAIDLAAAAGVTLIAFLRPGRFNRYG